MRLRPCRAPLRGQRSVVQKLLPAIFVEPSTSDSNASTAQGRAANFDALMKFGTEQKSRLLFGAWRS
jgi:hypothetical protein